MLLVAESGSTKTTWLTEKKELFQTIGFNPLFHTSDTIYSELMKNQQLLKQRKLFTKIFFYGAGCSVESRNKLVYDALKKYFTGANTISVDHDLKAAAIATYNGQPAITGILGTGSNSCFYNGKTISEGLPSLGYVLGDEGSGAYFGKKLLSLYLYNGLPEATTKIMKESYGLEKENILVNVYQKPFANVYLAGFAKILTETPDQDYMKHLVEMGFTEFFQYHVCCYENYKSYPVHFVGSIAFYFKDVLQQVAHKFDCKLGIVDKEPVYSLLNWHLKEIQR